MLAAPNTCFILLSMLLLPSTPPPPLLPLLLPAANLLLLLQMLVAIDKGADGCVAQTEHGAISTRIAPLTAVHDDEIMT